MALPKGWKKALFGLYVRTRKRLGIPAPSSFIWNRRWKRDKCSAAWHSAVVRDQVRQAFTDGWLSAGMSLLDIGCGEGHDAAWLARQGLEVEGLDCSQAVIQKARRLYGDVPNLAFREGDVCIAASCKRQYDAILDCGCLHCLGHRKQTQRYASSVATWCKPGAPLILLMQVRRIGAQGRAAQVQTLLQAAFTLEEVRPFVIALPAREMPVVMLRLVRHLPPA